MKKIGDVFAEFVVLTKILIVLSQIKRKIINNFTQASKECVNMRV